MMPDQLLPKSPDFAVSRPQSKAIFKANDNKYATLVEMHSAALMYYKNTAAYFSKSYILTYASKSTGKGSYNT